MKLRHTTITLAAAVLAGSTLAACGPGADSAASDGDGVKIGMILLSQTQRRSQFEADAFKAQVEKNGDTAIVQFGEDDPDAQTQQFDAMISQGVDVIALAAADVKVGGALVEKAKRQGIKTIAYDIPLQGGTPDMTLSRPQEQVAELQTAAALKAVPQGNYAVIKGDAGNDLAQKSSEIYDKALGVPGVDVVYDDWTAQWSPATARKVAENVLTRNNDDIKAFVVNNDGMATGVVQALQSRGLDGKVFVSGLDADEANLALIAEGKQTMTVWTPIDELARMAADVAHDLGTGGNIAPDDTVNGAPTKFVTLTEVNKDNLCDFVTKIAPQGWASVDKVFASDPEACPR